MMTTTEQPTGEAQIRKLIDDRVRAIRVRDVDGATANFAAEVLSFDVVGPLQYKGSDELQKRAADWLTSFRGAIGFEVKDLTIAASESVGFSHSLNHVSGTTAHGKELDMWWRSTVCYRKINGNWTITHEHDSVPFDAQTGQASLGLKP